MASPFDDILARFWMFPKLVVFFCRRDREEGRFHPCKFNFSVGRDGDVPEGHLFTQRNEIIGCFGDCQYQAHQPQATHWRPSPEMGLVHPSATLDGRPTAPTNPARAGMCGAHPHTF